MLPLAVAALLVASCLPCGTARPHGAPKVDAGLAVRLSGGGDAISKVPTLASTGGDMSAHRMNQGVGGSVGSTVPDGVTKPDLHVPELAPINLSYGDSPLVSVATAKGAWADAIAKAQATVSKMSSEDKVKLTTGTGWASGRCVGNITPNISSIPGWNGLCLEDSPLGVRFADLVTVFPSGLTTAATWSSDLTFKRGVAMGEEFKGKGVNLQLGPGMNMHRSPAAGRNWEMAGADPWAVGEAAYQTVRGIQSAGVQAVAKHYLLNEQEHYRYTSSSNVDDRTLREVYEHPFLRAVQADVAAVMCSYNLANSSWACQNEDLLNRRLKTDMAFNGFVMSDWGATHSGVGAANAGLDMTMPGDLFCCIPGQTTSYFGANLTESVVNGSVSDARLDDMATRILGAWYLVGQDKDYPTVNFDAFAPITAATNEHVNVMSEAHSQIARLISAAGTVVLKNENNALPLNKPKRIAIIGSDAAPPTKGPNYFGDRGGVDGTLAVGWGSGTADFAYLISPYDAITDRAKQDGTPVAWSFDDYDYDNAQTIAQNADVALVFLQSDSGEGYISVDGNHGDRNNLTAWHDGDTLVNKVASVNANTIVVIHAPGQLDLEAWIDNPNVTAVVWAGMPGSESGSGLVDVIYDGHEGGRLPFTIAKNRTDYPAEVLYSSLDVIPQIDYSEGVLVDYRYFDSKGVTPRYEFGYGLSFTTWEYSQPSGTWIGTSDVAEQVAKSKPNQVYPEELFAPVYEVTFDVANKGDRDGAAIPQLYVSFPADAGEPPKVLRAFGRFDVAQGASTGVKFTLSTYDLSIWDVMQQRWRIPEGSYTFHVGVSSRDIRGNFTTVISAAGN